MHLEGMRPFTKGRKVKATELEAIRRGAMPARGRRQGFADADSDVVGAPSSGPRPFRVFAPMVMPPRALFALAIGNSHTKLLGSEIALVAERPCMKGSSAKGGVVSYGVTDVQPARTNGWVWSRLVNSQEPLLVTITGTVPGAGAACGPHDNNWGVTADAYGFQCLCSDADKMVAAIILDLNWFDFAELDEPLVTNGYANVHYIVRNSANDGWETRGPQAKVYAPGNLADGTTLPKGTKCDVQPHIKSGLLVGRNFNCPPVTE